VGRLRLFGSAHTGGLSPRHRRRQRGSSSRHSSPRGAFCPTRPLTPTGGGTLLVGDRRAPMGQQLYLRFRDSALIRWRAAFRTGVDFIALINPKNSRFYEGVSS
jgi:hypothetical protein